MTARRTHVYARHMLRTAAPSIQAQGVSAMGPDEFTLARRLAGDLGDLGELAKYNPAAADRIVGSLVCHLRNWRPESVTPLGTLPAPTEAIRDPRSAR